MFDGSNTIVCYDRSNLNVRVAPDYYFAVGIDPETVKFRGIYRTWIQGKPPDFVLEVASPSTARNDETRKRDIYAGMGVPEYWRYDPTDLVDPNQRPLYAVALVGEVLVNGAYQPLPITPGPEGCIMGYSPALGVSLAVKDKRLMVYDHALEDFVAEFEEQERAKMQAQAEARAEREMRIAEQERRGSRRERAQRASRHHPTAGRGTAPPAGGRLTSDSLVKVVCLELVAFILSLSKDGRASFVFELGSLHWSGCLFVRANHPKGDQEDSSRHRQWAPKSIFAGRDKSKCHYCCCQQNEHVNRISAQLDSEAERDKQSCCNPDPRKDRMGPPVYGQAD